VRNLSSTPAAVAKGPDRSSQKRGIKSEGLRKTVAAEDHCLVADDIVDFSVGIIAVKQRGAAAYEVVRIQRRRELLRDFRLQ